MTNEIKKLLQEQDNLHEIVNGKTIAINLPKAKKLTKKQKRDIAISQKLLNTILN